MKYFFLFIAAFTSCVATRVPDRQLNNDSLVLANEGPWKSNFKNMVFSNVLLQLYGKDFASCLSRDASGTANYDWLNYDSIIYNKIIEISNSFIKRQELNTTIEGKKVILNFALAFRNSRELDSLTGIYYLQYQKNSMEKKKEMD